LKPFINFFVRFQPDNTQFFLSLQREIPALFHPSPSFASLRSGLFSLFCRFARLHSFTEMVSAPQFSESSEGYPFPLAYKAAKKSGMGHQGHPAGVVCGRSKAGANA
jgi:hypothetical protein